MKTFSCWKLLLVAVLLPYVSQCAPDPSPFKFPENESNSSGSSSIPRSAAAPSTNEEGSDSDDLTELYMSLNRTGKSSSSTSGEIQGRNFITEKLCAIGLMKCEEQLQQNKNYGPGGAGGGMKDVTLVQPVQLQPVGQPIAAIPIEMKDRDAPFSPFNGNSKNNYYNPPSSMYPYETQQGGIVLQNNGRNERCNCVPAEQCHPNDRIYGGSLSGGPATAYPSSNLGNSFSPQQSNYGNYYNPAGGNQNPGFIGGVGGGGRRPNHGQVGYGIDPRNKLEGTEIESNATDAELAAAASSSVPVALPDSFRSKRSGIAASAGNTRIIVGGASGGAFNNGGDGGGCNGRQVCCRNLNSNRPIDRNPPYPTFTAPPSTGVCGKRNAYGINGRILSGVTSNYGMGNGETDFGEYPWQAVILTKDNVFVCGASLIDSRFVVTAAHCIQSHRALEVKVRVGDWDVGGDSEFYPHQDIDVVDIVIHPDYNPGNLFNDIAILKLDGYLDLGRHPHIAPICLPDNKQYDFSGKRCIVTGWGKDAWGKQGKFQHRLREVDLPVLNHYDCEQKLKRTKLGSNFVLNPNFICAGGELSRDSCKGDGGGPLACEVNGVWQLAGITSWGVGCGEADVPGVYVRVSNYQDWMRNILIGN